MNKRIHWWKTCGIGAGLTLLTTALPAEARVRSNTQERTPDNVYIADFNGDGSADFLEVNGSKVVGRSADYDLTLSFDDILADGNRVVKVFTGQFSGPGRDQLCAVFQDGALACYVLSPDNTSMWWWFTQGTFVGSGEEAMVGDFNGDGQDDVMVYRAGDGNLRLYELDPSGFFFNEVPFSLGNLAGIDLTNKIIRVGEFGQATNQSDLLVFDPAWGQFHRFDSVINDSGLPEFWWALSSSSGLTSADEDVTVANIAGDVTDDVVIHDRNSGNYRFHKLEWADPDGSLIPISSVSIGQLPVSAGTVIWAKIAHEDEPGSSLRDDSLYFSNGWLVRTDARWDGSAFTYWWSYSRSAPKYTREQRTVWDLSPTELQQLGSLLQSYITEPIIQEHAVAHDWHHPAAGDPFFYRHRRYLTSAERFFIESGASNLVPLPMWDPNTPIPAELQYVKPNDDGSPRPALVNTDPHRPMPSSLASPALCSFSNPADLATTAENWHDGVHTSVGGAMSFVDIAPAASIFWSWHAFIDNIYARWFDCP